MDAANVSLENDNTRRSFADKWNLNTTLAFAETLRPGSDIYTWILTRNGFADGDALRRYLADKTRVLDAGCGNGRVTALLRDHSDARLTQIVGIDLVAADIARTNLQGQDNVAFEQKDLLGDLRDLGQFDFIYSQEVLHHTRDPLAAFRNLCGILAPGGEIAIYVYKKKAPAREFMDDFVRERIAALPYDEAMKICEEITNLGRALAEQRLKVTVPAVECLGIQAGEYDLQRFVYHFFAKCFWNPDLSFHDNAVINYDWYHPQLCSRHTADEIRGWFDGAGLAVTQECVDFYGITMRGRKPRR